MVLKLSVADGRRHGHCVHGGRGGQGGRGGHGGHGGPGALYEHCHDGQNVNVRAKEQMLDATVMTF